jgi:tetratricopeptide (TPR) repeat protein
MINPEDPETLEQQFEKLTRKRAYNELHDICNQILTKTPEHSLCLSFLGLLCNVENKFEESEKLFQRAFKSDPNNIYVFHWKGTLLTKMQKLEEAKASFSEALALDQGFIRSRIYCGYVHRLKRQFSEAKEIVFKAIEIEPDNPLAYNELGNIQMEEKDYEGAEVSFRKAMELDQDYIDVYNNLANLLKMKGDYEGSFAMYRRALEINKDDPKTINGLGCVHVRKREYDLAENYFQEVMRKFPYYVSAYLNQGIIFRTRGKLEESLKLYAAVEEANPYNATVWNFKGNIYLDKKLYEKSRECFEKGLEIDPYYVSGYTSLSNYHKIQKDFEKSEEICKKGRELCGEAAELCNAYANLKYDLKKYSEAEELYQKAMDMDKYYSSPSLNMGCIYKIKKQFEKAIEMFDKTLEIYKYSVSALNNKAGVYMDQKDYDKAREIYKYTLEMDPFYSYPYMNLGNIAKVLLKYDEAMEYYRKGLEINPLHLPTLSSRAGCYFSMGKYDLSLEGFKRLLEINDKNKYYYSNIGMCYLNLNQLELALEWMEKGVQKDTKDGGIKFRKGLVLFKLKRDKEFQNLYKEMIKEGKEEEEDVNKNLFNGYKLQVVYMKSRKQYITGLEVCEKILKMDPLEIGTIVDKMYMMNEQRLNTEVLEMAKDVLIKFPKNKNVLYQQGVAAMFNKDYELGQDCFEKVTSISKKNISALKNLFVCYKHNDKFFEQLQVLNKLKEMNNYIFNHLNEVDRNREIITWNGECLKKLDLVSIDEIEQDFDLERDHEDIMKEIENIKKKNNNVENEDENLMGYTMKCLDSNLLEIQLRILKKFKSKRKFKKYQEKYDRLKLFFALKQKKLKKLLNLFLLTTKTVVDRNPEYVDIINQNSQDKERLYIFFYIFRNSDLDIENIMEYLFKARRVENFIKEFIKHSLKLDAIVTEGEIFGRRHYVDCGFNVKSVFNYMFFSEPLLFEFNDFDINNKYVEFLQKRIKNFPKKISSFDILMKYKLLFNQMTGNTFIDVLFYLLSEHSISNLFQENSDYLYGDNKIIRIMLEAYKTDHYNFDFQIEDLSGYLAFIIFDKLRGIIERSLIEQVSGTELISKLGSELLYNDQSCRFMKHTDKLDDFSSQYNCEFIKFESYDPLLMGLENKIEITVSDNRLMQVICNGPRTHKMKLNFKCNLLFGDKEKRFAKIYDSTDSLFKPKRYKIDLDIMLENDIEEEMEIWRTVYIKEKEIVIPRGILKMYLKRISKVKENVVQNVDHDSLFNDSNNDNEG